MDIQRKRAYMAQLEADIMADREESARRAERNKYRKTLLITGLVVAFGVASVLVANYFKGG